MIQLLAISLCVAQHSTDKLDAAIWYAKQASEKADKIEAKLDTLQTGLQQSTGRISVVEKDVRRLEQQQATTSGEVKSLELWRSEATGKIGILGAGLALIMGFATSIFNRWLAKTDKRRGKS